MMNTNLLDLNNDVLNIIGRFQRSQKGDWATSRPVWRILADSTAVARQVPTPNFAKSGPRKSACLDLPSGPQHLQGTCKHVVEPDSAQPVTYTLGTSWSTCPSGYANQAFWFAQSSCSLHSICFLCLHRVYTQFTRPNQACKPRVNHE